MCVSVPPPRSSMAKAAWIRWGRSFRHVGKSRCARYFGEQEPGAPLHYPCTVAYLVRPGLFETVPMGFT